MLLPFSYIVVRGWYQHFFTFFLIYSRLVRGWYKRFFFNFFLVFFFLLSFSYITTSACAVMALTTIPLFCFQLLQQLAPGGRLIMPVGPEGGNQMLLRVDKDADESVTKRGLMGVIYGSLTSKEKNWAKGR